MSNALGNFIRFMFGGKRPLPASAAVMVGAGQQDAVEAPGASIDLLRRAMDAASEPLPEAEQPLALEPGPEPEPEMALDPIPSLFLQGPVTEETPVEAPVPVDSWLTQEWFEIELTDDPVLSVLDEFQSADLGPEEVATATPDAEIFVDPEREALVEAAFELARELLDETVSDVPEPMDETIVLDPEPVVELVAASIPPKNPAKKPAKKSAPAKKKATTIKRKKAAPEAARPGLPDDAVFLTDAVVWSLCGSWREFWLPPTDANSSQRVDEFREKAAAGSLTIWGLAAGSQTWTAIAPTHWQTNGFDPLSFLAGRENAFTETRPVTAKTRKAAAPLKFSSLKVSKATVEELWRSAAARAAA